MAPDLLGHGDSPAPLDPVRYGMPHAAADLAALPETSVEGGIHLLGYSMGGRLALFFALHYPAKVRTLTLLSASPGLATAAERVARRRKDDALADRIERDGIGPFADYWEALPLWDSQTRNLSPERRRQLRAQRQRNSPRGLANSLRGMGSGAQPNLHPAISTSLLPTLLLAGAVDTKFVDINLRMQQEMPGARLVILDGAGHAVHLERPRALARTVVNFWQKRQVARSGSPPMQIPRQPAPSKHSAAQN